MSKKFFKFFGFFFIACIGLLGLAACDKDEFKVEFMVQDDTNAWTVFKEENVVDGAIMIPEAPKKDYYTFAGWFGEEGLTTKFEAKDIEANVKAYAKYTANQVNVTIDGESQGAKNLIDVVNATYSPAPTEGLKFDGWYKDSACEVKWDGKSDVSDLYAQNVALVTYNNGYEVVHTDIVKPGTILENPADRLDNEESFEAKHIVKYYMSKYDIDYVDAENKAYDFTKPITKSTEIKVLWNTKDILGGFEELPKSTKNHHYVTLSSQFVKEIQKAPVVSFRNKITVEEKTSIAVSTTTYTVDYIYGYTDFLPNSVKKIIFGEGIQAISHFNGGSASSVEEIVLPSTLKILDNSFNNMPKLKGVTLPEGLEVLIGSFFTDRWTQTVVGHTLAQTNNNYEINVPDSVKNIAMMPNNLKFSKTEATAEEGDFYKGEDGRVYLNHKDGKVLVVDPAAVTGSYEITSIGAKLPKAGTIVVPEGVVGIQAGTYMTCFDYLVMPKSFKFINHNANISDYKEFYDVYTEIITNDDGTTNLMTRGGNVLFDQEQYDQYIDPSQPSFGNDSNISFEGLSLTMNVGGFGNLQWYGYSCGAGIVVMPTTKDARPAGIDMAFLQGSYYYNALPNLDKFVNYTDEVNTVYLTAPVENPAIFMPAAINVKLDGATTISYESIKAELIKANAMMEGILADAKSFEIQNNGVKVEDGAAVTADMFLTVVIVQKPQLIITSNWKVGYTGMGFSAEDYANPAEATDFKEGNFTFAIDDLTDLSVDSLKAKVYEEALKNALEDFYVSAFAGENAEPNLKYFFDNATFEFKVDGKDVDPTAITLENGTVRLDVIW